MSTTTRNWTEDYPHENGCYTNLCCVCLQEFQGHKRRATCKQCVVRESIKLPPLTDEQIEQCWNEAETEADAVETEWLLYGQKVATLAAEQATVQLRADYAALLDANYETQSILRGAEAEIERLRRHVELLQSKIDPEKSCACAYDSPDEVCLPHSPLVQAARAECDALRAENKELKAMIC